ncbi:substrate-binding domain-containing protein [Amycolatopsis viridis]|uniref:Ribose transport system substrate-binding protein n=1 Tax=Amycolatopsis viridis TaxID=185678 RepID=A0ABX0SZ93_9PSEU|nr:substrate-binding domain-containing protein [Amycolatopsis viridis]NIH82287.1 ribose transport system substrate-binding protein [Amycolatopsis viridis]
MPAVSRAMAVLDDIARNGPATLANLARRLALPKSSLLGICQALVEERLLAQDLGGRYTLGLAVAELAAAQAARPPLLGTLGVTVPNSLNPFYAVEIAGIRQAAGELGAEVVAVDAEQDAQAQVRQIEEFVEAGVDAIVLDAVHSTTVGEVVAKAQAAGVPVVAVNVGAEGARATVTTDNVQAGHLVGSYLAGLLGGRGNVAIVDGQPVTAVADRIVGFLGALRDHPDITVVARQRGDHSVASGEHIARRLLTRHPGLSAIFAINDPMAAGALAAMTDLGVAVPLVSIDGAAVAVEAIGSGGPWQATAAQDPARLGRLAVQYAAQAHAGDALADGKRRLLPTTLITRDTLADYQPWG